jgi:hypothetical protein
MVRDGVPVQDKYILSLMLILTCICVWHAVIGKIVALCYADDSSLASWCRSYYSTYDTIALGVLSSMYVGFHALFIGLIACIQYEKVMNTGVICSFSPMIFLVMSNIVGKT